MINSVFSLVCVWEGTTCSDKHTCICAYNIYIHIYIIIYSILKLGYQFSHLVQIL
jgi:hypothetical protein